MPPKPKAIVQFTYAGLPPDVVDELEQRADRIRTFGKNAVDNVLSIGLELTAAKETLGHGEFGGWLQAEFAWSPRTAQKYMAVAELTKCEPGSHLTEHRANVDVSALYLLAAQSTPPEVVEAVAEKAAAGERVTKATVKAEKAKKGTIDNKPGKRESVTADDTTQYRKDQLGNPVPDDLAAVFDGRDEVLAIAKLIKQARQALNAAIEIPAGAQLAARYEDIVNDLENAESWVRASAPYCVCDAGVGGKAGARGWMDTEDFEQWKRHNKQ